MTTTRLLVAVRRTLIAKGFAALLLALTVSPFTAPFATIDAAELLTESHASLDASVKPTKEVATAALLPGLLFVAVLLPIAPPTHAIRPVHLQPLRTIVLRL